MIYRFSALTPNTPAAPCNDTLVLADYSKLTLVVYNNGNTVYTHFLGSLVPGTFYVISSFGNQLLANISKTAGGVITISIPISVGDNVELDISLSFSTAIYNSYRTVFTLYHYDLGNDVAGGITLNPNMDIVVISNTNNYPYSGVIAYRKPFTNKIHFYKNNSSLFNAITLYDEGDDIISNIAFGTLCSDDDKEFYYITSLGSEICTQSVNTVVSNVQWIPTYEVTSNCITNCNAGCISPLATNTVTVNIDYSTLDTVYVDDAQSYPYVAQGITANVIDSNGIVIFTENFVNNIAYGLTTLTYTYTSSTFSIPTKGDYVIQGCIQVLGYEPQGIYSGTPTLNTIYKQLSVLLLADFTASNGDALVGTVFTANGVAPTSWSTNGKLIDVLTSGIPTINNYYKLLDSDGTTDFSNILTTDAAAIIDNMIFYSTGVAPISWGVAACVVETFPIVNCCTNVALIGCNVYEITQSDCSTVNIVNNSFSAIDYSLSLLSSTGWTVITSDTVDALTTLPIEIATDGVYDIMITYGGVEEHFIKIVACSIETCKLEYLDKLMCCNAGKNCDPCDECSTQDNYDFNAFSILMQTFFMLVNIETNVNYSYSTVQIGTAKVMANLYNIDNVITQAKKYCTTCDEPCSNCN